MIDGFKLANGRLVVNGEIVDEEEYNEENKMRKKDGKYERPMLELMYMHGRPVIKEVFNNYYEQKIYHPIDKRKCADCPRKAVMVIHELSGQSWYWCGECDIG